MNKTNSDRQIKLKPISSEDKDREKPKKPEPTVSEVWRNYEPL